MDVQVDFILSVLPFVRLTQEQLAGEKEGGLKSFPEFTEDKRLDARQQRVLSTPLSWSRPKCSEQACILPLFSPQGGRKMIERKGSSHRLRIL